MSNVTKNKTAQAINLAKNWLLYSGIQNKSSNSQIDGGFNSWYDSETKSYAYVYSEITGYALTTLSYFYHLQPQEILLERARKAAHWLMNQATHPSGGIKTRYYLEKTEDKTDFSKKERTLYTFDAGMVLFGACHLYKILKDKKYLEYAQKLAGFILSMRKPDGSFYALFDLVSKEKIDIPSKWSIQSGSFHAKLSLGLLSLFELTRNELYQKVAVKICDWSLRLQGSDGRFVTFRDSGDTHLHPHCYSAEGLYFAGKFLEKDKYLQAAKKAAEWAFSGQMDNGGIPSMYYKDSGWGKWERTDALSQVLRLGVLTLGDDYKEKFNGMVDRILSFQSKSGDRHLNGGIKYGFDEEGKRLDHINSWCTMFALQALLFYNDRFSGVFPNWRFMV